MVALFNNEIKGGRASEPNTAPDASQLCDFEISEVNNGEPNGLLLEWSSCRVITHLTPRDSRENLFPVASTSGNHDIDKDTEKARVTMGSISASGGYSVPKETQTIFDEGILNNPLLPALPEETKAAGKHVDFTGNDLPSIPITWRFAESAAALKGFEATMLNILRSRKYESPMSGVTINTDHASLPKMEGATMGLEGNEAVTPVFPNSDFGATATLHALIRRAEEGGSFGVDVALNYYSQWLVRSVGEYPEPVWQDVWQRHGSFVYRHYHNVLYTVPNLLGLLTQHDGKTLFKPDFFEPRASKATGVQFLQLKPVAQFKEDVKLEYNVGTRGNGYDKPFWPKDLRTEVVT
ncbi:hypothetical protein BST61_g7074 [Cercospora zeina]